MKAITISIFIAIVMIGGSILLTRGGSQDVAPSIDNVTVVDGKQIIEISAKGGYSPRSTLAKADVPTVIRMKTQGTFDCSSAISIPSLGYRKNLPPSGYTDIEIPAQKTGTKLQGLCAMGMYNFSVSFD